MPPIRLLSSNVLARVAALLVLAAPTTASAQGLIDFLWGGSSDWGGGRQTVSFNPKYTPGQIDQRWTEEIKEDFLNWFDENVDSLPMSQEELNDYLKNRTW